MMQDYARKKDQTRHHHHHHYYWWWRILIWLAIILMTMVFVLSVAFAPATYWWDETDVQTKVVKEWPVEEKQEPTETPIRRLPQAIIIGSRKSGTRALLKFLSANPNVRPANREVHFFDRMHNYRLGLDWYREQMPLSLSNQITIEKSPAYFVTRGVPERIKAMNSSVKLILVVRNPVTRLISDFSQLLAHKTHKELGSNSRPDYDDYYHYVLAMDELPSKSSSKFPWTATGSNQSFWSQAEASFVDYVRRPDGGINDQRRAVRAGMYSDYLERWLNLFGRDQLHVVDGERLISDPASELSRLEAALGLEPVITRQDFVFNQTKGFFCLAARNSSSSSLSANTTTTSTSSSGRRKREAKLSSAKPVCLGADKGRRHVTVGINLTEELQQFYAPFNEYLYSLIGRNFNWSHVEIK